MDGKFIIHTGGRTLTLFLTEGSKHSLGFVFTVQTRFFWVENLHARYFFGSRDLSRIFLGLKKIRIFFWVTSPSRREGEETLTDIPISLAC